MTGISARDICKSYGEEVILKNVSFHVNRGDKVGVVGANGAGKTTLLDILNGEIEADSGEVYISAEAVKGYLKQRNSSDGAGTVREEVMSVFAPLTGLEKRIEELTAGADIASKVDELERLTREYEEKGGYTYKGEMNSVLAAMAFGGEMMDKPLSTLSGGERTRLALACMLLKKPDLLFLDEPTNHLDTDMLGWLEGYLSRYEGTVMIVSHDRYFLDKCARRIFEIEGHRLRVYEGNYSYYAAKKKEQREIQLKTYCRQQEEIARQEAMIRRMKGRGTEKLAKRAASREKALARMERPETPPLREERMKLTFRENYRSGGDVLKAAGLSKSLGGREIFSGVDLYLRRGEKVCIVGANGTGKTTLLRILAGELSRDGGRLNFGVNVNVGYYDQEVMNLRGDSTVLEEIGGDQVSYSDTEIRKILGRFMFTGDEVFLKVADLSGGERARLALVKLMMGGANLLLLDEPTNHLDIASKEVFEEAVGEFPGTALIVSHDRYLLNRVPSRILELGRDGITEYQGGYDYYVQKKEEMSRRETETAVKDESVPSRKEETQRRIRENKEREAEERRRRRLAERLEGEIEELEGEIARLERQLEDPRVMADYDRLAETGKRIGELKEVLEEKIKEWADAAD